MDNNTTKKKLSRLSLFMAFTLDAIWNLRNQILHNGGQANIVVIASNIDHRFQEFVFAMTSDKPT